MSVINIVRRELQNMIDNKDSIEMIDVRTSYEYNGFHIDNSKNIPMEELERMEKEIDWNKKVVFICRSGARSGVVANYFSEKGKDVYNLAGGVIA